MGSRHCVGRGTKRQNNTILVRPIVIKPRESLRRDQLHRDIQERSKPYVTKNNKPYTDEEEQLILEWVGDAVGLAKHLGRSWWSVRKKRQRLRAKHGRNN